MRSRRIVILIIVAIAAAAGWYYYTQQSAASSGAFVLSGTIEATEINLPSVRGGQVLGVFAGEGDPVEQGQRLVDIDSQASGANERITSPIDGVVLERLVEPDEWAPTGSTVMVVADMNALTLKVYVPENRYGQISLGQSYPVTVDSFPNETFQGKVTTISDRAEFTPRNVQTKDSRQTTVYAVKLALEPSAGKLKPGMPAEVTFTVQ